jgi:hypothetical protein
LVAQGTREIEIFDQVDPRKNGFESSNQGAPGKGGGASRRLGFSPRDKGLGATCLGQRRGVSDNLRPRFHLDLLTLGKLQLPRQLGCRNCIGITFSFVICVVPLKKYSGKGSNLGYLGERGGPEYCNTLFFFENIVHARYLKY